MPEVNGGLKLEKSSMILYITYIIYNSYIYIYMYIYKWLIFHCHVWWPEGISGLRLCPKSVLPEGSVLQVNSPAVMKGFKGFNGFKNMGIMYYPYNVRPPSDVCWFRFAPVSIVISTINHSYWSYKVINQLRYLGGLTLYANHGAGILSYKTGWFFGQMFQMLVQSHKGTMEGLLGMNSQL